MRAQQGPSDRTAAFRLPCAFLCGPIEARGKEGGAHTRLHVMVVQLHETGKLKRWRRSVDRFTREENRCLRQGTSSFSAFTRPPSSMVHAHARATRDAQSAELSVGATRLRAPAPRACVLLALQTPRPSPSLLPPPPPRRPSSDNGGPLPHLRAPCLQRGCSFHIVAHRLAGLSACGDHHTLLSFPSPSPLAFDLFVVRHKRCAASLRTRFLLS